MVKASVKVMLGKARAKRFCINIEKKVYIGRHCSLKGKQKIYLEDDVTIRPHVQLWGG